MGPKQILIFFILKNLAVCLLPISWNVQNTGENYVKGLLKKNDNT